MNLRCYFFIPVALMTGFLSLCAQTQNGYVEPSDPQKAVASEWSVVGNGLHVSWVSKDKHYAQHNVPVAKLVSDTTIYAWRGERVNAEAVLFSKNVTSAYSLSLSAWTLNGTKVVAASKGKASFLNYVITDQKRDCGANDRSTSAFLVPDIIDNATRKSLAPMSVRPVWCAFDVPATLAAGTYDVTLSANNASTGKVAATLTLHIVVGSRTMPKTRTFHVDFWQQPYAVSRWYNTGRWTQAHYDALRPYLQQLARCGQRVVSTILFYEPWGDQSYDKFDPMIKSTKKADGSWSYDYSVFDHYVALCDSCGINGQINCYSMVPWDMTFCYFDEATNKEVSLKTTTSSADYSNLWTPFLQAFAKHLKKKGWYDKTCIAMDERSLDDMNNAYNVLQSAVPGMKMALAGNYHKELVDKIYDYCIAYGQSFTDADLSVRKAKGFVSTCYTCCAEAEPNIFTNSDPYDAAFLPLYCLAKGLDGYLHWSWMNWDNHPLTDSRYRLFPAGDTYCVYPGNRSSVRYERFIEGVQNVEKYKVLKAEYTSNNQTDKLKSLNSALNACNDGEASAYKVDLMESLLNGSPAPATPEVAQPDTTLVYQKVETRSPLMDAQVQQGYQTTGRGNRNSVLLKVQVPSTSTPLTLKSIDLTLKGQTLDNIEAVKIYTSSQDNFPADASPKLVGFVHPKTSSVNIPLSVVTTSATPYYIYVTVDVKKKATLGAMLDAVLNRINEPNRVDTLDADPEYAQRVYQVQQFLGMPDTYGSHYYRIPAMVVAKDGSIVTAYDKRFESLGDAGSHRIDLVSRRSTDGGKTWSEPLTIAEGRGAGGFDNGFGDPALVVTAKGRIICISCAGDKGFAQGQKDMALIYSDDNGQTWSKPANITANCLNNLVDGVQNDLLSHGYFVTSGRGVVYKDGRIMFAANYRLLSGKINEYVIYSDDEGANWTLDYHLAYSGADESKLLVLNDGRLMISVRQSGSRGFNVTKGDNLQWGRQYRNAQISGAACNSDILYYNRDLTGKRDLIFHTIPATIPSLQRANLLLLASRDGGNKWTVVDTLQAGAASYSTMERLNDGSLAVFFEDESNGVNNWTMNFITLTKAQVEEMMKKADTAITEDERQHADKRRFRR